MVDKQTAFEFFREDSFRYLNEIDSRGWIGWEKVDPLIQDIIGLIHRNPHLFHYGESCAGTGHIGREDKVSMGYVNIAIDGSDESRSVISELEATIGISPYVSVTKIDVPQYKEGEVVGEVEVYAFRLDIDSLSEEQRAASSVLHSRNYRDIWEEVESILEKHCSQYEPVWDKDSTEKYRPDFFK